MNFSPSNIGLLTTFESYGGSGNRIALNICLKLGWCALSPAVYCWKWGRSELCVLVKTVSDKKETEVEICERSIIH